MSASSNQTRRHSAMQRKLKELLRFADKADIHTHSSGHQRPNSLTHKPLYSRPLKPIRNKTKCKDTEPTPKADVEEVTDGLQSCTIGTNALQEPRIQESEELIRRPELGKLRNAKQEGCTESEMMEQDNSWFTHSKKAGVTRSDRLRQGRCFDTKLLRPKNLIDRKCPTWREAAIRHESKLQQALRKLPASEGPCRERLEAFSDVFDDVCDGSPVFGEVLREIKKEYDSYVASLLTSQSLLQDKSADLPVEASVEALELKEAASQVFSLEQEAKRALEENYSVRLEYEDAQTKALVDQKEKGLESCDTRQCDEEAFSDVMPCDRSSIAQVEAKRQQVWRVWGELQELERDIKEMMMSSVITGALETSIRDSEDEILNIAASNVRLQRANKDLEQNISLVLNNALISEETKAQILEDIWTALKGQKGTTD